MLSHSQLAGSRFFLVFIAGLAALGPLSIDMYLPTLPDMANSFDANISAANLTVSTFMFGMAIGQLTGGPLSDQIGRKTVGLIGLLVFIIASLMIIFASSIGMVQVWRAVQAVGGGFCSVICMAQARDVFAPEEVAGKFTNIILVILIAPMIGPALGAVMAPMGWRFLFWVLIACALMLAVIYAWRLPETNRTFSGRIQVAELFKGYVEAILNRTDGRLIAIRFAIFSGFSTGVLFTYVTTAPFVFIEYYRLSVGEFAVVFAVLVATMMIGNRAAARSLGKVPATTILHWANAVQILTAAVLVAYCVSGDPKLWVILTGLGLLILCNGAISPVAGGHFISLFSKNIGSASSLNSSMMFGFGSIIGGLAAVLAEETLLPVFAVMLASASLARLVLWSATRRKLS